jgi:MtN3 and saliva related transmembrane protein
MIWKGMEIVGFIGGSTISFSLLPQVMKTWTSRSADDISFAYQAVYILGCTLVNIYAISERLWPVFVPCLLEELLIVTLTIMKMAFAWNEMKPCIHQKNLQCKDLHEENDCTMVVQDETSEVNSCNSI